KKLDSNHPDVGNTYSILGDINCKKGNKIEAKKCYENVLSIYTQKFGENHQKTQGIMTKLKNFLNKDYSYFEKKFLFELHSFYDISKVVPYSIIYQHLTKHLPNNLLDINVECKIDEMIFKETFDLPRYYKKMQKIYTLQKRVSLLK
ncbi:hypothetical protein RFI_19965, partial [Reticulomyxa filosa]